MLNSCIGIINLNYKEKISAIEKTKLLGLQLEANPYPFKDTLNHEDKTKALRLPAKLLKR